MVIKEIRFFDDERKRGVNLQLIYNYNFKRAKFSTAFKGYFLPLIKNVPKFGPL